MKKLINKKGFTLVELLATVVILGIIMVVAIPNVIGILDKNRATTYVEDAKKLVARAEYALRSGKTSKLPSGQCAIFNLAFLDNNEFENGPYGHSYDKKKSFVIAAKNSSGEINYYVRLIEPLGEIPADGFKGVTYASKDDLNNRNSLELVKPATGTATLDLTNDAADIANIINNYVDTYEGVRLCMASGSSITPYITEPGFATLNSGETYNPGDAVVIEDVTGQSDAANLSCSFPTTNGTLDLSTGPKTFTISVKNGNTNDKVKFKIDVGENYVIKSIKKQIDSGSYQTLNLSDLIEIEKRPLNKHPAYKYVVEIEAKSGHKFPSDTAVQAVQLVTNTGTGESCGALNLKVPYVPEIPDTDPPVINNVKASIVTSTKGKVKITWDAMDSDKVGLGSYNVYAYEGSTLVKNVTIQSAHKGQKSESMTYEMTGLNTRSGANSYSYTFKVCGTDKNGNAASDSNLQNAGGSGPCAKSATSTYRWVFSVTGSISDGSFSSNGTVDYGGSYSGTISANKKRTCPGSISVEKDGASYSDYSYSNCSVTVRNITGNIKIIASCPEEKSGCLIEGTKILLKNGKKKKIEDVKFDDLVAVWNYDTGKISYEYPIWLENGQEISNYKVTIFSDGTSLKTAVDHALFSLDDNEFISVNDTEKYKVGTRIAKVVNGKIKEVKIKEIREVKRKVKYYQVVSTRYYNVIADNFLTTDYAVELSNAYGFDKNITWPKERLEYISNPANQYKYSDFADILPYYLYYGLTRDGEGKKLERYGIGKEEFRNYFLSEPLKEGTYQTPEINANGKNIWMVTTSLDKVTEKNKDKFKYEEGSYYTLPENNKVKYYINSVDNKEYKPGEKVKVNCGIYFEAVKK